MSEISKKGHPDWNAVPDDIRKFKKRYAPEKQKGYWCTVYACWCRMKSCDKCPRNTKGM